MKTQYLKVIFIILIFSIFSLNCSNSEKNTTSSKSSSSTSKTEGLYLNKTETYIFKGETEQLTAVIMPAYASDKTIVWSSSDVSIATVSDAGFITAVSVGNSVITVKTKDGSYNKECKVTVYNEKFTSVWNTTIEC